MFGTLNFKQSLLTHILLQVKDCLFPKNKTFYEDTLETLLNEQYYPNRKRFVLGRAPDSIVPLDPINTTFGMPPKRSIFWLEIISRRICVNMYIECVDCQVKKRSRYSSRSRARKNGKLCSNRTYLLMPKWMHMLALFLSKGEFGITETKFACTNKH